MPTPNFKEEAFARDKDYYEKHFPDYEYLGNLGKANATVFKGKHRRTKEIVAIKFFPTTIDEGDLRRFEREADRMMSLTHKNIVKVKSRHLEAHLPHIIMEWVEKGDIRGLLKKNNTLDILTTIHLGLQMEEALRLIHGKDIFHYDIKPENILYRDKPNGEIQFLLTDFGISRLKGQNPSTGLFSFTPEYASPERFYSDEDPSEPTDFYSLGVVLYECLSGAPPYILGSKKIEAFMYTVKNSSIPPLILPNETLQKELPMSILDLVIKLLSKDPSERLKNIDVRTELKKAEFEFLKARARENIFKVIHLPDMVGISSEVKISPINFSTNTFSELPQFKLTLVNIPIVKIKPNIMKNWEGWPSLSDLDSDYKERIKDNLEWINSSLKKEDKINSLEYMRFYFYRWILFIQKGFSNILNKLK
ncbi:serine/threonine-protein kinase [Larkinella sp.]|uniref:serine/threonine-protein kinase n=1 Tax=Larkinella sp. TaxID=2034517 RepID=UPI003BA8E3FB